MQIFSHIQSFRPTAVDRWQGDTIVRTVERYRHPWDTSDRWGGVCPTGGGRGGVGGGVSESPGPDRPLVPRSIINVVGRSLGCLILLEGRGHALSCLLRGNSSEDLNPPLPPQPPQPRGARNYACQGRPDRSGSIPDQLLMWWGGAAPFLWRAGGIKETVPRPSAPFL